MAPCELITENYQKKAFGNVKLFSVSCEKKEREGNGFNY